MEWVFSFLFPFLFGFKAVGVRGPLRVQGLSNHRRSMSLEVIMSGGDEGEAPNSRCGGSCPTASLLALLFPVPTT